MPTYTSASENYINSTLDASFKDTLFIPVYNLSCLLADTNGQVPKEISDVALRTLDVTGPGVVTSIPKASMAGIQDKYSKYLPQDPYDPNVSYDAYIMYLAFKNLDSTYVVSLDVQYAGTLQSPVLSHRYIRMPEVTSALGMLYIETYELYKQLLSFKSFGDLSFIRSDLTRMSSNISWICPRLDQSIDFDLLSALRDLQKNILYIKNLDLLFVQSTLDKLQKAEGDYYAQ